MNYTITQLTLTNSGTYNESGDMLPDMLNGGQCPTNMEEMTDWLWEEGYVKAEGFSGWGYVMRHEETGELININDSE